jgi:hypothetical protein
MRRIFWGFCRNWFLKDPLHYLSSRSAFGFEFAEIFVMLGESESQQLPDSASRGVAMVSRGVAFKNLASIFRTLNGKPAL